ncbi:unnamed protein product [Discula destructiva]
MASSTRSYDYIVAGGGLAGCVVASRLKEYLPQAHILIVEAGPDTRARTDILRPEALNLGTDLDWNFPTEPSPGTAGRNFAYNAGKGLGGSTLINSGGWLRGSSKEYDEWAALVKDDRWSYEGQLPYMKKSESWFDNSDPKQHGQDGPISVASSASTGRKFPLCDDVASAWDELGVPALPNFDYNSGDNLGRAQLCEARKDGLRQHAANCYSLDGVDILVNILVKKVVIERVDGKPRAVGVELSDGQLIKAAEVIVSAGVFKSPQLLMLSGIGPASHLAEHDIETIVDLPEVGQNLHDHTSIYQFWRLKNPEKGLTLGTPNPLFLQPEFAKGIPLDWVTSTDVPHKDLAKSLQVDEGQAPDEAEHPFLKTARTHFEHCILYCKLPLPGIEPDFAHLTTLTVFFLPTSRGSVTLRSGEANDGPRITTDYIATEADRYVARSGLRQLTRLMLDTEFGRTYIAGETTSLDAVSLEDDDEKLDARVKAGAVTTWHAAGTCAMGAVVDAECRVKGVEGLRVVDASVLPVPISSHIQATVYALGEQAAAIISRVG